MLLNVMKTIEICDEKASGSGYVSEDGRWLTLPLWMCVTSTRQPEGSIGNDSGGLPLVATNDGPEGEAEYALH